MQRPLLPILLAFMAGITAGAASPPPGFLVISAFAGSLILFLVAAVKQRRVVADLCLLLVFFFAAFLNSGYDIHEAPGPRDISRFIGTDRLTVEGSVSENPRILPDRVELIVQATGVIERERVAPVDGKILLSLKDEQSIPEYGDLIRFKTRLNEPRNFNNPGGFDYRRYLRMKGIRVRGTPDKSGIIVIRTGGGNPLKAGLERYRSTLRKVIRENASSPEGEIIQAMVLGEQSEIPREVMDAFNRTGTSHVIAISGFNIGIIAAFSFFLAKLLMRQSEYLLLRFNIVKVSALFSFIPVILFTFISGFGISVVRAALMILAFLVALCFGREREPFNILAFTAILILAVSPLSLFDISFQLSFAAVASILFMVPKFSSLFIDNNRIAESRHPRLMKMLAAFALFLAATLSATLGTAPLIIYHFNILSLITLLANIIIVPIMGYLVILLGMVIIAAAPVSPLLGASIVKMASALTGISASIVDRLSHLPFAFTFAPTPTLPELGAYYCFLFIVMRMLNTGMKQERNGSAEGGRNRGLFLKMSLCLILLFFVIDYLYHDFKDRHPGLLSLTAIDVGQGSSVLVDFPGGTKMLIDGGGFYDGSFDIGRYVLAPWLWHEKISRVDIVVLTHPHPDHLNGLLYVLNNFRVREVWTNGDEEESEAFQKFKKIIFEKNIRHLVMKGRERIRVDIGGAAVHILNLRDRPAAKDYFAANDRSLVLKVTYGDVSFMLPGDISSVAESELIRKEGPLLRCTVMAAPHHGGFHSSSPAFLQKVRPQMVVFSCGAGNVFRFPHPDVLERYGRAGCRIFRTDKNGAVTFRTDGFTVSSSPFMGM